MEQNNQPKPTGRGPVNGHYRTFSHALAIAMQKCFVWRETENGTPYTAKELLAFAQECLPEGKNVFLISTQGAAKGEYRKTIRQVLAEKHCREIGAYWCRGFDTFGPFKLVGGVAKDHPTAEEIKAAVDFYAGLPE